MIWWLVVFLAVFLIGVTKSGFGSGVGLMIVPMTAIAMGHIPGRGSEAALGLLLPLLILGDFIAVWQYRKILSARPNSLPTTPAPTEALSTHHSALSTQDSELSTQDSPLPTPVLDYASAAASAEPPARRILRMLLPGTAIGVVLGGLMLWWFHQHHAIVGALIRVELGIESILLVGLHWWRQAKGVQDHLVREPLRSHFTGAFSGASSTLAHAAGPIIAMYLLPLRLDRRLFVGTCAIYFFLLNSAKLPAYWLSNQFARAELPFTMQFAPLVIAGALFGWWINKRMTDKIFSKIVYAITFVLGWYILIDGGRLLWEHFA